MPSVSEQPLDTSSADEPGDALTGHAARAAGERLRELAEAEHARTEADEAAELARVEREAEQRRAELDHPLRALGAEPFTDEIIGRLGDDAAGYAPCPFCEGFGAVNPDQLIAALPDVIARLAPYPESTIFRRCDECDGWGSVLTGGRTGENGIQPCPVCQSHGYIDTRTGGGLAALQADRGGVLVPVPPVDGVDPFTVPPPDGVAPAAGMVWLDEQRTWGYPARTAELG